MPAEIPIIHPPFSEEPLGQEFNKFLVNLYATDEELFYFASLKKCSDFLGFNDTNVGAVSLSNWVKKGILKVNLAALTKPEIGLLKLTQVIFAEKARAYYEEVRSSLARNLADTAFAGFIGETEIVGKNTWGRVSLIVSGDRWYIDRGVLKKNYYGPIR